MLTVNSIILIQEPDAVNSLSMVVVEEMPIDSLRLPNVWRFANLWCTPNLQSQHDILTLIQVKKKKQQKKKKHFLIKMQFYMHSSTDSHFSSCICL